jgi:prepilin-type N-terminal cleavage/methylation domain-containing protein
MTERFKKVKNTAPENGGGLFKAGFGHAAGDKGFTMMEVLIAMVVLAVALIGLASLATSNLKSTDSARRLTQALNLAMEKMEVLEAVPFANLQFAHSLPVSEDGNVNRACSGAAGTPPVFTCTPSGAEGSISDPTVTIDGMVFTWGWTVTYVNLDNDTEYYAGTGGSGAPVIDSRDLKRLDLTVSWRDIFGPHTTTFTLLRSRL